MVKSKRNFQFGVNMTLSLPLLLLISLFNAKSRPQAQSPIVGTTCPTHSDPAQDKTLNDMNFKSEVKGEKKISSVLVRKDVTPLC